MTADPLVLIGDVDRATDRLLRNAGHLAEEDLRTASLLPGWTRGHVLSHIAHNADSLVRLLTWARTGVETPQYASREQRDADIEADAGRDLSTHLANLTASAARFSEAVDAMPPDAWARPVRWMSGREQPAAVVVWARLREVEIHHVDLRAGYGPADWPAPFTHRLLHELTGHFATRREVPRLVLHVDDLGHDLTVGDGEGAATVSGASHQLAAWLTGRSDGRVLRVEPPASLPQLPNWL